MDAGTIPGALERRIRAGGAGVTFHLVDESAHLSLEQVAELASAASRLLAGRGVRRGDRVGILGPNRPAWLVWAYGAWMAGAVVVPLPWPVRIASREALGSRVSALVLAAGCRVVVTDPGVPDLVPNGLGLPWDVAEGSVSEPVPAEPDDLAVIQFTSGSTASPKGAMLSHRNVLAAVQNSIERSRFDPGTDRLLAWLPFFHDFGLFGSAVRSLVSGCETHLFPTERFARDPALWLRLAGELGATYTEGPPSAWAVAFRAAERSGRAIDLSSIRRWVHGAESVDPRVIDQMSDGRAGLSPGAVAVGYGLAEATLGVTATIPGEGVRLDPVGIQALAEDRAEPSEGPVKRVVSCGVPLPDMGVRIKGRDGDLPERRVGEIEVRGSSVMRGYAGEVPQPFDDGWLRTGDLGYLAEGELFVTGRSKDVVILLGQNYAPEDIEWAAGGAPGVRQGRCVAFGVDEGRVAVAVEPAAGADPGELPGLVRQAVAAEVGPMPLEVLVVPKGTIPKTTSGKLRRGAVRDAHARGELPEA